MRHIAPHALWIGHCGHGRNLPLLHRTGIQAVIDLALNELPLVLPREMAYARFPLVDGVHNPPWLIAAALETAVSFIATRTPTLVLCGAGMSRSPAVTAGSLAILSGRDPRDCLEDVIRGGPADVSPAVWADVLAAVQKRRLMTTLRQEASPDSEVASKDRH